MKAASTTAPTIVLPSVNQPIVLADQDQALVEAMQIATVELTGGGCTASEAVSVALQTHAELTQIVGFDAVLFAGGLTEIIRGDHGADAKEAVLMLTTALLRVAGDASGYWCTE